MPTGLNEKGFSLLAITALLLMVSISMGVMSKSITSQFRAQLGLEFRDERMFIRRNIYSRVSCGLSMPANNCTGFEGAKDASGKIIVSAAGTAFGRWMVKANCQENGQMQFLAALPVSSSASGVFLLDPMGNRLDWNHPKADLFRGYPAICEPGTEKKEQEILLDKCLAQWGANGPNVGGVTPRQRVKAYSKSETDIRQEQITDTAVTTNPEKEIVFIIFESGSEVRDNKFFLQRPNTWYCLGFKGLAVRSNEIYLSAGTQIATVYDAADVRNNQQHEVQ